MRKKTLSFWNSEAISLAVKCKRSSFCQFEKSKFNLKNNILSAFLSSEHVINCVHKFTGKNRWMNKWSMCPDILIYQSF